MTLLCEARTEDDLSVGFCCHEFCCARCAQIGDVMARLCAARTEDEARGGGAADARRWTALRSPVESRAMLKTVFRAAADHAAQVGALGSLLKRTMPQAPQRHGLRLRWVRLRIRCCRWRRQLLVEEDDCCISEPLQAESLYVARSGAGAGDGAHVALYRPDLQDEQSFLTGTCITFIGRCWSCRWR